MRFWRQYLEGLSKGTRNISKYDMKNIDIFGKKLKLCIVFMQSNYYY